MKIVDFTLGLYVYVYVYVRIGRYMYKRGVWDEWIDTAISTYLQLLTYPNITSFLLGLDPHMGLLLHTPTGLKTISDVSLDFTDCLAF